MSLNNLFPRTALVGFLFSSSSWVSIRHHLTTVARLASTLARLLGPLTFSSSSFSLLTRDSFLPLPLSFPGRPQPFSAPLFLSSFSSFCSYHHCRRVGSCSLVDLLACPC